jgi:cell division protein FtsB
VGAGRAALAKRAKAGGKRGSRTQERKRAEAARRGLSRGKRRGGSGKSFGRPIKGAANELMRFYGLFEQKFLIRQRLRTILLTLAAAWALWTFVIGDAGVFRLLHVKHQNEQLAPEIEKLQRQEQELLADVKALEQADPVTVEHVAREQHALVKDGEVLVRFYDGEAEEE